MISFSDIPKLRPGEILIFSKLPILSHMKEFIDRWGFEIGDSFPFHSYKDKNRVSLICTKQLFEKDGSMRRRIVFTEEDIYECFDTQSSFRNRKITKILT